MSSLFSIPSRTMSTMTGRTTSNASTSVPHTPSSSNVVTGFKASLGSGPFFHAHLQEGQRIEDQSLSDVRYEVAAYAIGPKIVVTPSGPMQQKLKRLGVNGGQDIPHGSQRHAAENAVSNARITSSSLSTSARNIGVQQHSQQIPPSQSAGIWAPSASATAMSSDKTDLGKLVQDVHASLGTATPAPQHYHYLTRSQSASAAADAGHLQQAPKLRKQNASYSPGFGTPAYRDTVENVPVAPAPALFPTRGRYLSPIEEIQCFPPEKQGDSASLNSATSAQSNLFIHRSVRRTPSTSTFNSGHSEAPRSPDDPTAPHNTGPSRSYGHPRPVIVLPVIPASPRESQNVFEQDPASQETMPAYPMPVAYSSHAEYSAYQQQEEQDLGATLSTPRFAVPHYLPGYDTVEEQDLSEAPPRRISILYSQEPSLLTRSESLRTELTYLTAQDSGPNSRRASAVTPGDLEAGRRGRSPLIDGDTTLVNSSSRPSPAARLKASLDTLLLKSPKMRKSPGGLNNSPMTDAVSTISAQSKAAKWVSQLNEVMKKHAPWANGNYKPAEVLFWTGFLAPWCWLIGGWMLSRSGQAKLEGSPNHAKEPGLPLHTGSSLQLQLRQPRSREMHEYSEKHSSEGTDKPALSVWQAAKNSSVELLESLRGPRGKESSTTTVRGVMLHNDVPIPVMITTRVDPWVVRCRVAAIVSGMFILALCIVALVVLVRSL